MKIKYRILGHDPSDLMFGVRYYTDAITEDELATEFDYPQGQPRVIRRRDDGAPTRCRTDYWLKLWKHDSSEEEVKAVIMAQAPVQWFALAEKIKDPTVDTSMAVLDRMPKTGEFTQEELQTTYSVKELSDAEIDQLLNDIRNKQARQG